MKTKITLWLEKGKPTKVRTTKHEDFYLDDLTQFFDKINKRKGEKKNVAK